MGTCQWTNFTLMFNILDIWKFFLHEINVKKSIFSIIKMYRFVELKFNKKIEQLYNFFPNIINRIFNFIIIFIVIIFFWFVFHNLNSVKYRTLLKSIFLIFLIYTLLSSYQFLQNSVKFGKYTSFNQRFWKITYLCFWLIEFFLFFLFTYLTLISPNETFYVLDSRKNFFIFHGFSYNFYLNSIFIASISFFFYWSSNAKYQAKYTYIYIFSIITFLLTFIYFFIEFLKFYYIIFYYKYKIFNVVESNTLNKDMKYYKTNYMYTFKKNIWIYKCRTQHFFILLLMLLKFWHIFFVYVFFLFYYRKLANEKIVSHDILSYNMQNFSFLLFFNMYYYILYFKKYLYVFVIIRYLRHIYYINCSLIFKEIFSIFF